MDDVGILAGWMLLLLGPTFYIRSRIGPSRWRALHRFSALAWLAGLVHGLGDGTDAGQTWFIAMTCTVAIPAVVLLAMRITRRSQPKRPPHARSARQARQQRPSHAFLDR